ncbi:MAG TPA: GDP-mannose 4,6-dehydratase [Thioploca sp.]|nr:GDP-mannose 4,6-dehydratase [Thioploca sp.]
MKHNRNPRKPVAFITGVTGQDGAYLADLLLSKGYRVYGGYRRGTNKTWRLDYLGITSKIQLIEFQLNAPQSIMSILQEINPDEVYHLAAESFVADSYKFPNLILEANTHATCNILEAIRLTTPNARVFFASSSEIFGHTLSNQLLDELSTCYPKNPYAISKLSADYFIKMYREEYDLFVCSGILFNHESPLRGGQFVSRKITSNVARLKLKSGKPFELGNLNSSRDWGAAIDYTKAMSLMLQSETPKDFIIATGTLKTVRDLLEISAMKVGFEPLFEGKDENELCIDKSTGMKIACVSKKYFRPHDTMPLAGNPHKIESELGWERTTNFKDLISMMVEADLDRWHKGVVDI